MEFLCCIQSGCCWYTVFRCCGCVDENVAEKEVVKTQPPPIIIVTAPKPNPFIHSGLPKDAHLQSAYD